jgi:Arc/MetJ family transcription regulator
VAVTSIDINSDLLAQVKALTGVRTNKEAVDFSLSKIVQIQRQRELIEQAASPDILDILSHMHEPAESFQEA